MKPVTWAGRHRLPVLWTWLAALLLAAVAWNSQAQTDVPALNARVNDLTATLDAAQTQALEQKLAALEAGKGAQLVVLMVPSTGDEPIESFALRVFEAWQPGRKDVDDGALLVVAKNDRSMRIEVGYGLEGAITDVQAGRIIREYIAPHFAAGDFNAGLNAGVDSLIALVNNEPLPEPVSTAGDHQGEDVVSAVVFTALLALMTSPVFAAVGGAVLVWGLTGSLFFALAGAVAGGILSALIGVSGIRKHFRGRGGPPGGGFGGGFRGGRGGGFRGGGGGFRGGGGRGGGGGASGGW